jgi:hypothetical protein
MIRLEGDKCGKSGMPIGVVNQDKKKGLSVVKQGKKQGICVIFKDKGCGKLGTELIARCGFSGFRGILSHIAMVFRSK